jgi:hypothetical protein
MLVAPIESFRLRTNSRDRSCSEETLTDIVQFASRGPIWLQRASDAQACSSTQAPIGMIRPHSSATGMNSAGPIGPRCAHAALLTSSPADACILSCRFRLLAREARKRFSQYLDALEVGMEPALVNVRTHIGPG